MRANETTTGNRKRERDDVFVVQKRYYSGHKIHCCKCCLVCSVSGDFVSEPNFVFSVQKSNFTLSYFAELIWRTTLQYNYGWIKMSRKALCCLLLLHTHFLHLISFPLSESLPPHPSIECDLLLPCFVIDINTDNTRRLWKNPISFQVSTVTIHK